MKSCIDVANLFLKWANRDGDLITNLKMQKLVYYAQAWHLVYFKEILFKNTILAWDFGPVVPDVYHEFKCFSSSPIKYKESGEEENGFGKEQIKFLNACYGTFIKYSAFELVNMTHNEDPWKDAYKKGPSTEIFPEAMRKFYSGMLKNKN